MSLSVVTLALAKAYTDKMAKQGSVEVINKAVKEAVSQSKEYTDAVVSQLSGGFNVEIKETLPLPTEADGHTIYFIRDNAAGGDSNFYNEYMFIAGNFELIGSTKMDLSDYWTSAEVRKYVNEHTYTLPIASSTTLGGVKIDMDSITVNKEGMISVIPQKTIQIAEDTAQKVVDGSVVAVPLSEINGLFQ